MNSFVEGIPDRQDRKAPGGRTDSVDQPFPSVDPERLVAEGTAEGNSTAPMKQPDPEDVI